MYPPQSAGSIIVGYHKRNSGSRLRILNDHVLNDHDASGIAVSRGSMSHLEVEVLNLEGEQAGLFSEFADAIVDVREIQIPPPNPGQSFFHSNGWMGEEDFDRLIVQPNHDKRFAENAVRYGRHRIRERNAAVVKARKDAYRIATNGRMPCEVCTTSFVDDFGFEYLEAHHKMPLSMLNGEIETKLEDLALLCANCHRAIHRIKNNAGAILSVEEFKMRFFSPNL